MKAKITIDFSKDLFHITGLANEEVRFTVSGDTFEILKSNIKFQIDRLLKRRTKLQALDNSLLYGYRANWPKVIDIDGRCKDIHDITTLFNCCIHVLNTDDDSVLADIFITN